MEESVDHLFIEARWEKLRLILGPDILLKDEGKIRQARERLISAQS